MTTTLNFPGAGKRVARPVTLPFGKHAHEALPSVPAAYLQWLVREAKLSTGLRAGVEHELARRGQPVAPRPPRPLRPCPRHPGAGHNLSWQGDTLGRQRIRVCCAACGRFLEFAPLAPCYVTKADAAARDEK
jgi:hypothetical protein